MKVPLYNQKGERVNEILLPKEMFDVSVNFDLIHQVVLVQMANQRKKIAKTKDRSEVRGGGKKPWRQKGTGRARHGSIRSPIWKGGGVTFGPTGKEVFKKRIPKKMKRKALFMALSAKLKDNFLLILDKLEIKEPKTKLMKEILDKLFLKNGSGLIVLPKMDEKIIKASRNISKVATIQAKDLNVLTVLNYKYIVILQESIDILKNTFLKD